MGKDNSQLISDYIDQNKDILLKNITEAVRIKSVIGNEAEIQEFMKKKYAELGLKVESFEADYNKMVKHEAYCDLDIPYDGRENVIGIYEGNENKPSLTLHGHIDVVSPEPVQKWTKDPWGGIIEGNRLYGRGAADMKAGVMINWFAMKTLFDLGLSPGGTVQLHSTIAEETGGGGGALACLEEGYLTDGFITTEPHDMKITTGHAGILYFRIKVQGKSAHAGLSHLGVNAIGKMFKVYNALEKLHHKRAKEVRFELFEKGSGQATHLSCGTLKAGDWVSNVAGEAELEGRIGFIPGETREDIRKLIHETVENACKGDEWLEEHPPTVEWFGWNADAWYQDPQAKYVTSFKETAERLLGREVEIVGRAAANDARFTQYYNRSAVGFGPIGANVHGVDEYVEIDTVISTAKIIANHILEWTNS